MGRKRNRQPRQRHLLLDKSNKAQWRVLLLAFPLYGAAAALEKAAEHGMDTKRKAQCSEDIISRVFTPEKVKEFLDLGGVERARTAFQLVDPDEATTTRPSPPPTPSNLSRQDIPQEVDAVLSRIFGLTAPQLQPHKKENQEGVVGEDEGCGTGDGCELSPSELTLLQLWSRERSRTTRYFDLYQHVQQEADFFREEFRMWERGGDLSAVAGTSVNDRATYSRVNGQVVPVGYPGLPSSTACSTAAAVKKEEIPAAESAQHLLRQPANMAERRYEANKAEQWMRRYRPPPALSPGNSPARSPSPAREKPAKDGEGYDTKELLCEVCLEPGSDLYRCVQCQGLRHEACGGPHPPSSYSPSAPNAEAPPLMLCKDCSKALALTSSSSSLRSSTSTDEREELGSLLDDDDDDDSLSGFIARSSEDDDSIDGSDETDDESEEEERGEPERPRISLRSKNKKRVRVERSRC